MGLTVWRWGAMVAASLLSVAGASRADPADLGRAATGYTYYNRPGAALKDHNAELLDCVVEAMRVRPTYPAFALLNEDHRALAQAAVENCMVVRGWRVVRLSADEGSELAKLPTVILSDHLSAWIGSEAPTGEIVRGWANEAANGATRRYEITPSDNEKMLSVRLISNGEIKEALEAAIRQQPPPVKAELDPKWPLKALTPAEVATAPPFASVIIFRIKGLSLRNGIGMAFGREGPDKDTPPSKVDKGPDFIEIRIGLLYAKKDGDTWAYALPPGRWRVVGFGSKPFLDFCLGSPSFEAKAGDVVFAGTFDMSAEDVGPDLSLTPVKAWLGASPAAGRVRPAAYINGSRGPCGGNAIYAFEIKGAPFEPGYTGGSMANAHATPGAAPLPIAPARP